MNAAFSDLRAWHERIVAAHPGEQLTEIPVRVDGEIIRYVPSMLPRWMLCDERDAFLKEVARLRELHAGDEAVLAALKATPGVPSGVWKPSDGISFVRTNPPVPVKATEPEPQAPRQPVEFPSWVPKDKTARAVVACLGWRMLDPHPDHAPIAAKFVTNEFFGLLAEQKWSLDDVFAYREDIADALADIVALRAFGVITTKHAKDILAAVWAMPYLDVIDHIISSKMLEEAEGDALVAIVQQVITDNPKVVEQIKGGKVQAAGFLVGQVMKAAKGKADPTTAQQMIKEALGIA